jgi:hypothetical protein
MEGTPQDYGKSLELHAEMLRRASTFEAKAPDQPERDKYCRLVLLRTADLVESCSLFVEAVHVVAGQVLMRSMLEDLIKVLWATLDETNAANLSSLGLDQLKLMMRANLQGGTARIKDHDGNDHSERFLKEGRLSTNGKKKTVESMAKEAGAIGLYNMFYRFASLQTHGNMLDGAHKISAADVSAVLGAVGAIAKATGHISIRWLLGRERPSNEELLNLLGVR